MKNILIISTSLRNNSNSYILATKFMEGAKKAGNNVELISLQNKTINFCKGCFACQKLGKCIIKDDANSIVEKMLNADVICWATPVYYYSISGQMKTLIDRANSLYSSNYKFREVYLLLTATENESFTKEGAIKACQGWVDCFDDVVLKDTLFVGDVTDPSDILGNPLLNKAYELGKKA